MHKQTLRASFEAACFPVFSGFAAAGTFVVSVLFITGQLFSQVPNHGIFNIGSYVAGFTADGPVYTNLDQELLPVMAVVFTIFCAISVALAPKSMLRFPLWLQVLLSCAVFLLFTHIFFHSSLALDLLRVNGAGGTLYDDSSPIHQMLFATREVSSAPLNQFVQLAASMLITLPFCWLVCEGKQEPRRHTEGRRQQPYFTATMPHLGLCATRAASREQSDESERLSPPAAE